MGEKEMWGNTHHEYLAHTVRDIRNQSLEPDRINVTQLRLALQYEGTEFVGDLRHLRLVYWGREERKGRKGESESSTPSRLVT